MVTVVRLALRVRCLKMRSPRIVRVRRSRSKSSCIPPWTLRYGVSFLVISLCRSLAVSPLTSIYRSLARVSSPHTTA